LLARRVLTAVVVVLAAGSVLGGDPDVADLLYKKAKKAFASKDFSEAEAGFRRAIQEVSPFPEARLGLAETLEKLDRSGDAERAYRACIAEIEDAGDPSKWKSTKARAQQALTRLTAPRAEIAKINEAFIRRCLDFAKKHADSEPLWARKAYETVLVVDPYNENARQGLKKLGEPAAAPAEPPTQAPAKPAPREERFGEPIIRKELWEGAPEWSVGAESIVADVNGKGKLFWLEGIPLDGRYSVQGRFHVTRTSDRFVYGLFFGGVSDGFTWWEFVVRHGGEVELNHTVDGNNDMIKDRIFTSFDHGAWHTVRIDVTPGDVTVTLDGEKLFDLSVADRKAFDGKVCLFAQEAAVEWRDLGVKH